MSHSKIEKVVKWADGEDKVTLNMFVDSSAGASVWKCKLTLTGPVGPFSADLDSEASAEVWAESMLAHIYGAHASFEVDS